MASLTIGIIYLMTTFFSKGLLLFVSTIVYEYRFFHIEHFGWWIWGLCFLGEDFSYDRYLGPVTRFGFYGPIILYIIPLKRTIF